MGITIFTPAPLPLNERQRSEAAMDSGLLNRIGDPHLSRIANDTCHVLNVHWCGITIMVGETQHVIASSGGLIGMFRRSTSLCSYAIYDPDRVFVVLDAPRDERFAGNPFVDDGVIHFFAASAIRDRAGYAIGALCITDKMPRARFSDEDAVSLRDFASGITTLLH